MDVSEMLLAQHALTHSADVARADGTQLTDLVWSRLSDQQRRECLPGHNSIVWILWHVARWEDVVVNSLIRSQPEVMDRGGWLDRLGLDSRDAGTGASDQEVVDLSRAIDLQSLKEYRDAVGRETRAWLQGVGPAELDYMVNVHERAARAPAYFRQDRAAWVVGSTSAPGSRSIASLLLWSVIGHAFGHLGNAAHVTSMLGIPGR